MDNCPICLEKIQRREIATACQHHYHQKCLDKWLRRSKECPCCRQVVNYKIIVRHTRSRTAPRREKIVILRLEYLMALYELSIREEDKQQIIKKMLSKIFINRIVLKKNTVFWRKLGKFKLTHIEDNNEYYKNLFTRWKIKFN